MNIYQVPGEPAQTIAAENMTAALKTYTEWIGEEPERIEFLAQIDWIQDDLFGAQEG